MLQARDASHMYLDDIITKVLAQSSFFSGLGPQQLQRVAALCSLNEYPQSAQIYRLGDPADDIFVLISGTVRFTIGLGHREASAGEISCRGAVFGWTGLVETADTRFSTALCLTPCTALSLSGSELLHVMDEDHDLGYPLLKQAIILISSTLTTYASG